MTKKTKAAKSTKTRARGSRKAKAHKVNMRKASASDVNKLYDYLTDPNGGNLTPAAAAAVIGNWITESQLDPAAIEGERSKRSGSTIDKTGISFAQWSTKANHAGFFAWLKAHPGVPLWKGAVGFYLSDKTYADKLRDTTDIETAIQLTGKYEHFGVAGDRAVYGRIIFHNVPKKPAGTGFTGTANHLGPNATTQTVEAVLLGLKKKFSKKTRPKTAVTVCKNGKKHKKALKKNTQKKQSKLA
jgi:Phage tail lysozyme